jgi:hypothetical protein
VLCSKAELDGSPFAASQAELISHDSFDLACHSLSREDDLWGSRSDCIQFESEGWVVEDGVDPFSNCSPGRLLCPSVASCPH